MTALHSALLERTGKVRAAFSTRAGGTSPEPFGMNLSTRVGDDPACVEENRRRFLEAVEAAPSVLALPLQVHGTTVVFAGSAGVYPGCDALVTTRPDVVIGVTVADCVPILLADPHAGVVGAVHAGWRGTAAGVLQAALRFMKEEHGCSGGRMLAAVGPSAGVCCYEVGEDVAGRFDPGNVVRRNGRVFLDLRSAAWAVLRAAGLPEGSVEFVGGCTICAPHLFHSYRRDGDRSGRMLGAIRLVP
jgi:YfiH family protein